MADQPAGKKFKVEVDGHELLPAVDTALVAAFVEDSLNLPDMFQLTFRDPGRSVLDDGRFKVGSRVKITAFADDSPGGDVLITGEVTTLEADFDPLGTMTVIRGYDPSHRLFRGRVTETYQNVTYSDVAQQVAKRAGLHVGRIDPAPTVHPYVSQPNLDDWHFLRGLAAEIGFEVGCVDGKFEFRSPRRSESGPKSGTLAADHPLQLTFGSNLLRFRSIVTSTEQVKEVHVRGWDVKQKRELVGVAAAKTQTATIGAGPGDLAGIFGGGRYVGTATPYATQAEVDAAARSLADQIAGAFAEFEGVARGNPKLRAGTAVSLGLVKEPFDGKYVLTSTRHRYDANEGYTVAFTVTGRQERSLYGLAAGPDGNSAGPGGSPVAGVVPALVTDVNDPDRRGRVKLAFPWLSPSYTSDWARVAMVGAGKDRGMVILPEVHDEVLVAFEHGDMRRPYVVGGLYNGVDTPNLGDGLVDTGTGGMKRRGFISKAGHQIVFLDDAAKSGVMLSTSGGKLRIALKETGTTIRICSDGNVEIEAKGDVTVKAKNGRLEAQGSLELKAGAGLKIDGGPTVEVKGSVIKLN